MKLALFGYRVNTLEVTTRGLFLINQFYNLDSSKKHN